MARPVEEVREQVIDTLEKIRPYIRRDGGDVAFKDYRDGVVTITLLGACIGCGLADVTIKGGIEAILMDEVPEVTEVRLATEY